VKTDRLVDMVAREQRIEAAGLERVARVREAMGLRGRAAHSWLKAAQVYGDLSDEFNAGRCRVHAGQVTKGGEA
jgi:hypothetical protein